MKKAAIGGGAVVLLLVLLALAVGLWVRDGGGGPPAAAPPLTTAPSSTPAPAPARPGAETHQGFLYGRISTLDGTTYEGRLRWGGDEEAFWGDYFNGFKDENRWAAHVPPGMLEERRPIEIFGIEIATSERRVDLGRPFMARFGDIARIEARVRDVLVTLKSGTAFQLDRFSAGDFDDGIRVWDGRRGVVDLDSLRVRAIEFLPTPALGAVPYRLHGTVRTRQGEFTGFVQWDREKGVGTDVIRGRTADDELELRFDTVRSLARRSPDSALVTLLDGREIAFSGTRGAGRGNRGIYVDDRRYGRVLVSWEAFERVDFTPGGSGPAFDDFRPGRPLTGTVSTRAGRRLTGRLVYDLDESETTETLDAPSRGVDYTIPFGMVASIVPLDPDSRDARLCRVILFGGEELPLERTGDLGEANAGLLIFAEGDRQPEYVPWADVERIDFDRAQAMDPPLDGQ